MFVEGVGRLMEELAGVWWQGSKIDGRICRSLIKYNWKVLQDYGRKAARLVE